jgi:hypothetical protein
MQVIYLFKLNHKNFLFNDEKILEIIEDILTKVLKKDLGKKVLLMNKTKCYYDHKKMVINLF